MLQICHRRGQIWGFTPPHISCWRYFSFHFRRLYRYTEFGVNMACPLEKAMSYLKTKFDKENSLCGKNMDIPQKLQLSKN